MNLKGSYKALLNHSIAALLAAIEIYNKPQIQYRDEAFVILLINAWELALKAILSKNKHVIFYPKKRTEAYKTFSLNDVINKAQPFFPRDIQFEPLKENVKAIESYRDNAIHFYNQDGFGVLVYGLAQTSIVNYKDLVLSAFGVNIAERTTLHLMPLAFGIPPNPIKFLQDNMENLPKKAIVSEYLSRISKTTKELENLGFDTGRFLTVFTVKLESVKKISSADITVGVDNDSENRVVEKRVDPNLAYTLREMHVLDEIGTDLQGVRFTTITFRAIVWKYNLKDNHIYCWRSKLLGNSLYSRDIIAYIRNLTKNEIEQAREEYSTHMNRNRRTRTPRKGSGVMR